MRSADSRFSSHCAEARSGSVRLVCRSIRKYGKEAIKITILAISNSWPYLCVLEKRAIETFNTFAPLGYNATAGGEGAHGVIFSKERREKASKSAKKAMNAPEVKARHKAAKRLECNTEKGRKRLIEIANRPDVIAKKSLAIKRFCENNPLAMKERNEKIRKTSASPESRIKRSIAAKAASTPDVCARRSELARQRKWLYKGQKLTNASPADFDKLLADGWRYGKPSFDRLL